MVRQVATMVRREFRAMNTDCLVILRPGPDGNADADVERAVMRVRECEERYSRFLPSSDLSCLNGDPRDHVPVSAELAGLLDRAIGHARLSGGIFDPVVLTEMLSIGYDRSFEHLPASTDCRPVRARRFRWTDVSVDVGPRLVTRPPGAMIDLGGVAKGAAADAAMAELAGHYGALVDLGGDICTTGGPGDADFWLVGTEDGAGRTRDVVSMRYGAIATSSVRKRRWTNNGTPVHHVIDPRTGRPASSNADQCSAIADRVEQAEIAAKVGLVLGVGSLNERDHVGKTLRLRGVAWVGSDSADASTTGWRNYVHG